MIVSLDVLYELGHMYAERWTESDHYCPACGKHNVWVECGDGDYYAGPQHLCLDCNSRFHLPLGAAPEPKNWQDRQRLAAIRKHGLTELQRESEELGLYD